MDLINVLNEVSFRLSQKFNYINSGGCGRMALIFSNHLQRLSNVKDVRIHFVFRNWIDIPVVNIHKRYSNNFDKLNGLDEQHSFIHEHLMVSFVYKGKRYYVDSDGVYTRKDLLKHYNIHLGSVSRGVLSRYCSQVMWNPTFDVTQIPRMRAMVKEAFDKYMSGGKI